MTGTRVHRKSFATRTRKSRMGCGILSKEFAIVLKLELDISVVLKLCKKSFSAKLGQDSPCLLGKQVKFYFASG